MPQKKSESFLDFSVPLELEALLKGLALGSLAGGGMYAGSRMLQGLRKSLDPTEEKDVLTTIPVHVKSGSGAVDRVGGVPLTEGVSEFWKSPALAGLATVASLFGSFKGLSSLSDAASRDKLVRKIEEKQREVTRRLGAKSKVGEELEEEEDAFDFHKYSSAKRDQENFSDAVVELLFCKYSELVKESGIKSRLADYGETALGELLATIGRPSRLKGVPSKLKDVAFSNKGALTGAGLAQGYSVAGDPERAWYNPDWSALLGGALLGKLGPKAVGPTVRSGVKSFGKEVQHGFQAAKKPLKDSVRGFARALGAQSMPAVAGAGLAQVSSTALDPERALWDLDPAALVGGALTGASAGPWIRSTPKTLAKVLSRLGLTSGVATGGYSGFQGLKNRYGGGTEGSDPGFLDNVAEIAKNLRNFTETNSPVRKGMADVLKSFAAAHPFVTAGAAGLGGLGGMELLDYLYDRKKKDEEQAVRVRVSPWESEDA